MENNKNKNENNFDNLRNYYPNIIELFKWELLQRNYNLPTEINDLIFKYLLDLNSLNGKSCIANKYLKIIEKQKENDNKILELEKEMFKSSLVESEESKKEIDKIDKIFSETLLRFWKTDKERFFICKQEAFNSLENS